jgi:hypothetical protein
MRKVVSQGGRYAFAEAAYNLKELAGVEISAQHVLRLTERVGKEWVEQREREIADFERARLARAYSQAPPAAAVMLDGGRVQTREEPSPPGVRKPEWHEPKYACLLTLEKRAQEQDPQPEPPTKFTNREEVPRLVRQIQSLRGPAKGREEARQKVGRGKGHRRNRRKSLHGRLVRTVLATMAGVHDFGQQVAVEVHKRGLDLADWKACVADGQASNWTVYEVHLKPLGFVGILDFLHLLTYLYAAAQALGGTEAQRWRRYVQWMTWAWQGQREKVLVALNSACAKTGAPPKDTPENDPRCVLSTARTYVTNNTEKMDYPRYRKLGLPISSAPVESVIKQFNKRVKGTEKFWRPSALEAVLQIRAAQLSEDGREDRLWATPRPNHAPHPSKVPAAA